MDDLNLCQCQAAGFGRHVGNGWAVATMSGTCADLWYPVILEGCARNPRASEGCSSFNPAGSREWGHPAYPDSVELPRCDRGWSLAEPQGFEAAMWAIPQRGSETSGNRWKSRRPGAGVVQFLTEDRGRSPFSIFFWLFWLGCITEAWSESSYRSESQSVQSVLFWSVDHPGSKGDCPACWWACPEDCVRSGNLRLSSSAVSELINAWRTRKPNLSHSKLRPNRARIVFFPKQVYHGLPVWGSCSFERVARLGRTIFSPSVIQFLRILRHSSVLSHRAIRCSGKPSPSRSPAVRKPWSRWPYIHDMRVQQFVLSMVGNRSKVAMDQYLYIPFLGGWTSIYQLFWCSPGG